MALPKLIVAWEAMMSKRSRRPNGPAQSTSASRAIFHPADVLFALEWAAVAPGLGGWNLVLDQDGETRLISVVPPGAEHPTFFITRDGSRVTVTWLRQQAVGARPVDVGQFATLREAVLTLCPLSGELAAFVDQSMDLLYPPALRDR